jgi:hypothetical protein
VQWTYSHWTGRWAALGFQALLFSRLPLLSIYPAILLGLQLVQFLAVLAFWHTLVGSAVSLRARLGLALGFFAFLHAGYPAPGETVYWATGGLEYQLSVSLAILLLAALCSDLRFPLLPSQILTRGFALGLFGFVVTGFHELVAVMLLGVLFTGTIVILLERRPGIWLWVIPLLFVAVGCAVSLLAPGNAERAATDFPHGRSASQGAIALARLLLRVLRWIDVRLLAASVLLILTVGLNVHESRNTSERERARTWSIPLAGALIFLGTCIAIAYMTGGPGNGRVQNLLYVAFCLAWSTSLLTLLRVGPDLSYLADNAFVRIARPVAAVLLGVALISSINNGSATRDLVLEVAAWRRAMPLRYEIVRQAARLDGTTADVVIPPVAHPATFYRGFDVGPNAETPSNRAFAKYFGVRSVRVESSAQPVRRPTDLSPVRSADVFPWADDRR